MNNIGTKLRLLRESKHYKQEYVANYLGIGQSAYSRIENGDPNNILLKHIKKLTDLYQISVSQLFDWDGKIAISSGNVFTVNSINHKVDKDQLPEERLKELEEKVSQIIQLLDR